VLGRVIAGVGGAGCQALVSLIILDLFPLRQVAALRSYVNIAATTGRSLGGPIGGFLADTIGWRWSFILQSPLIVLSGLIVWYLVPQTNHSKSSTPNSDAGENEVPAISKWARIDFAGAFLIASTITSIMLAAELAGQKLPWNHPIIFGLIALSLASGVLFVYTENHWALEPIFPLHLLKKQEVVCGYLVLALQVSAQLAVSTLSSTIHLHWPKLVYFLASHGQC
jgi:MFS family permease